MNSLTGSIDLLKLEKAGIAMIHCVRCVVIPLNMNDFYVTKDEVTGKAKSAYLSLNIIEAREVSRYGHTHYAKQSLSKEFKIGADAELLESKKKTYLGSFKPSVFEEQSNQAGTVVSEHVQDADVIVLQEDELPF